MSESNQSEFQEPMVDHGPLRFEKLKIATLYWFELVIKYQEETTGKMVEQVLSTLETSTSEIYETTMNHTIEGTLVYLTVVVNDPFHVISNLTFTAYEPSEYYPMYFGSGSFEIGSSNQESMIYSASIDKLSLPRIEVEIYATKTVASNNYGYCLLYAFEV